MLKAENRIAVQCQKLLNLFILTLIFEGILRKAFSFLTVPLFFLKDILCLYGLTIILKNNFKDKSLLQLQRRWNFLLLAFLPVLIVTGLKDIVLVFFGGKQYLLFPVVCFIMILAFPKSEETAFKKFMYLFSLFLIPTTFLAIAQNALPETHWLNRGVSGESLSEFSAAGYLRVSSTFSFTGQYSYYLAASTGFLITYFFLPYVSNKQHNFQKIITFFIQPILILALIIGGFITGGRTAVFGIGLTLVIGFLLSGYRLPQLFSNRRVIITTIILFLSVTILFQIKPEYFAAYSERSTNLDGQTNNQEVSSRVIDSFINWTNLLSNDDVIGNLFGKGLGVMSNGADQLSNYAKTVRLSLWTETDFPTTIWEGGVYLALIWYSFRIGIILLCFQEWRKIKQTRFIQAASFFLAYVLIIGITGTLAIQPPLAVWFWISVGSIFCLANFDQT